MSNWTQIHSDVYISGADGFSFIVTPAPRHDFHVDILSDEEKEFIEMCLPGRKPRMINGVERPLTVDQALRMYLCESMSQTFAYAQVAIDYKSYFMIGARSDKDMFKLKLKLPETADRNMWGRETKFYVRVSEGDTFSDKGQIKNMQWEKYNV